MDENHPSQGSVRLLRRGGHQRLSSSSSASSSASRSVAFVAMIPHSISHPFLDLKSLTIPHLCEVQKLKTYIVKKTTSLWGSFTEFNCFFPSFSIEYSLLLQELRRSSQESSLCEISCHDDDDDDDGK